MRIEDQEVQNIALTVVFVALAVGWVMCKFLG
jgi:hypothetical protein